jgi:hypothetical protein
VKLQKDLREFIELLNSAKVEYVIVGGHAVAYHGYPRFTGDIDFLVRPTANNAQSVIAVLQAFGFGAVGISADDFTREEHVVQLGLPPNRIDLLTSISGVTFDEVWSGRVRSDLDETPVSFIGKEQLLRNKRSTGRLKDLADAEQIEKASAKQRSKP